MVSFWCVNEDGGHSLKGWIWCVNGDGVWISREWVLFCTAQRLSLVNF